MYTTHISFEKQFTPKLNIQSYMQYCNVFGTNALISQTAQLYETIHAEI